MANQAPTPKAYAASHSPLYRALVWLGLIHSPSAHFMAIQTYTNCPYWRCHLHHIWDD